MKQWWYVGFISKARKKHKSTKPKYKNWLSAVISKNSGLSAIRNLQEKTFNYENFPRH